MIRQVSISALVCLGILLLGAGVAYCQQTGSILAWGGNYAGQCDVPAPNEGFVAVAAGEDHSLGLKSDGTIVAWGGNYLGQCDVPSPNEGFMAVAGGGGHSLGLKADGTIVAWGWNELGQCDVPSPNEGFVAVAGGEYHSLGLKTDGTIVAWGDSTYGQCDVPSPNEGFVAIAGGFSHSLGLRSVMTAVEEPEPGDLPGAAMIAILSLSPNPFNPSIEVSFEIKRSGQVDMEIYDVSGRRVRTVALGILGPGIHRSRWDGRNESGHTVRSGVYIVRLRGAGGESAAAKAVLLR
jgi:hypothetical protein